MPYFTQLHLTETVVKSLHSYPATCDSHGHISVNGCPLALFPHEDDTMSCGFKGYKTVNRE